MTTVGAAVAVAVALTITTEEMGSEVTIARREELTYPRRRHRKAPDAVVVIQAIRIAFST